VRKFCIAILLLLSAVPSFSAIQMECASVGANGDVTITWNNTSSSAGFYAYYIYHSTTTAGAFTLIDSVLNYATQTYNDPSANAANVNAFYYVELKDSSGATTASDSIEAIKLTVTKTLGFATLTWNTTDSPLIATNSVYYKIYREYPTGTWTLIDSIDMSAFPGSYQDEITICGDTIKYRIEVTDSSGCTSVSNVDGKYFQDQTPPVVPVTDSVSVNAAGNAIIGWNVNPSKDTYAYVILEYIGGSWVAIDTVYGINNTFLATTVNVNGGSQQFAIYAVDSCSNRSVLNAAQQTLFLTGTLDPCNASVRLTWNGYINSPMVPLYFIYMSENGGSAMLLDSTVATSYSVRGLKSDTAYCFFIRAVLDSVGSTSTSTEFCITAQLPILPQFAYIRSVSVNAPSEVMIYAYVDIAANVKEHKLLRSQDSLWGFSVVGTMAGGINPFITFLDNSITDADKTVYYYQVESTDSCGSVAVTSQVSHTIVAAAVAHDNFTNSISWNNYGLWFGGDSSYTILRDIDSLGSFSQIGRVPATDSTFLDTSPIDFALSRGKFCYRIVASEGSGNKYGFRDTSYSAEVCVEQFPDVFIPNAFRPGSFFNSTFIPAERFVSADGYDFKIFNRWGQSVFETTNPGQGWDGSFKNNYCPMDIYCWLLTYKNSDGATIKKTGMVTLVN
jgi:gliding motility-associated-like protein